MKNKLRFIMPRLIGATIATGLAALIITTLFKVLLGLTLLAGAMTAIARTLGKGRNQLGQYGQNGMTGLNNGIAFGNSSVWAGPIQPVKGYATQKGTSVVPID